MTIMLFTFVWTGRQLGDSSWYKLPPFGYRQEVSRAWMLLPLCSHFICFPTIARFSSRCWLSIVLFANYLIILLIALPPLCNGAYCGLLSHTKPCKALDLHIFRIASWEMDSQLWFPLCGVACLKKSGRLSLCGHFAKNGLGEHFHKATRAIWWWNGLGRHFYKGNRIVDYTTIYLLAVCINLPLLYNFLIMHYCFLHSSGRPRFSSLLCLGRLLENLELATHS